MPHSKKARRPRAFTLRIAIVAYTAFLIFFGCFYNLPDSYAETENLRANVDFFVEHGADFLGGTTFKTKEDLFQKLGNPLTTRSEQVKNRYTESTDTIYDFSYNGLHLKAYEVTLEQVVHVYHIVLKSRNFQNKWALNVGAHKDYVRITLGKPDASDDVSWTYYVSMGYEDLVKFYFQNDLISRIEWRYIID